MMTKRSGRENTTLQPSLELGTTLDACKLGRLHILVLCLCFAVLVIDGYDAQSTAYVAPFIAAAWGIKSASLAPAFSAGLFGLALGSMFFGALSDRFGRKMIIIVCLTIFGVLNVLKAFVGSVTLLVVLQFVAGLGVGGAMPNTIALVSEYAPARRRALFVTLAAAGYSFGTASAGFVAANTSTSYGWQATFVIGGLVALILVPVLACILPDSVRFMALSDPSSPKLKAVLRRLDPTLALDAPIAIATREQRSVLFNLAGLFREGRAPATMFLWLAVFMDLLVIYYMASLLVVTLNTVGNVAVRDAALTLSMYSLAGLFGTPVVGQAMDRFGHTRVLGLSFVGAAVCIALSGFFLSSPSILEGLIVVAGFLLIGAHLGTNAFASSLYPTAMRGTGVGWALGVGRMTASVSPLLGSILLSWKWQLQPILLVVAAPAVIAAVCLVMAGHFASTRGRSAPLSQQFDPATAEPHAEAL